VENVIALQPTRIYTDSDFFFVEADTTVLRRFRAIYLGPAPFMAPIHFLFHVHEAKNYLVLGTFPALDKNFRLSRFFMDTTKFPIL